MGYEEVPKRGREAPMVHIAENGDEDPLNEEALSRLEERQKNDPEYRRNLLKALTLAGVATLQAPSNDVQDSNSNEAVPLGPETVAAQQNRSEQLPEDVYAMQDGSYATTAPETSLRPKARPENQVDSEQITSAVEHPTERLERGEYFAATAEGWKAWWRLGAKEIQFLDASRGPVGEPVPFQEFVIDKDGDGKKEYLLTPGSLSEDGLPVNGIAREWIRYVRADIAAKYGVLESELQQINIAKAITSALNNADEPALQAAVRSGEISTLEDITRFFGMNVEKSVDGDERNRTRAEYLYEEIAFTDAVPPIVQEELRSYIVALAAKESRFDAGLPKNFATAWGVMQLTDDTRRAAGYDVDQKLTFMQEVQVAGERFSMGYGYLKHWMTHEGYFDVNGKLQSRDRPEAYEILRSLYSADEEGEARWEREVETPALITSYNAGEWTVGEALYHFAISHDRGELQQLANAGAYELYTAFTEFAADYGAELRAQDSDSVAALFGPDAKSYFASIYAGRDIFKDGSERFTVRRIH